MKGFVFFGLSAVFILSLMATSADDVVVVPGGLMLAGFETVGRKVEMVDIKPFKMDKFPVTNSDFRDFIRATKYKTEAEVFGWSFVFQDFVSLDLKLKVKKSIGLIEMSTPWWVPLLRVFWRQPAGPGSGIFHRLNHPVVQVSWNDALAFCSWKNKRLPSEDEWEWAACGGMQCLNYPWGDRFLHNRSNLWQGKFPQGDTEQDGYHGTAPVTAYPPQNSLGLYDMMGNTWEWTSSIYQDQRHMYVQRGASWIDTMDGSANHKALVTSRMGNSPDYTSDNVGFRCVATIEQVDNKEEQKTEL